MHHPLGRCYNNLCGGVINIIYARIYLEAPNYYLTWLIHWIWFRSIQLSPVSQLFKEVSWMGQGIETSKAAIWPPQPVRHTCLQKSVIKQLDCIPSSKHMISCYQIVLFCLPRIGTCLVQGYCSHFSLYRYPYVNLALRYLTAFSMLSISGGLSS